jgi:hypothetical protein
MMDDPLHTVTSVHGHTIRVTATQWVHVVGAHDYMAGNIDKVLETIGEPDKIIEGKNGESLALRAYEQTNITQKTAVVIYRDEENGCMITAFLTSQPQRIERRGKILWQKT